MSITLPHNLFSFQQLVLKMSYCYQCNQRPAVPSTGLCKPCYFANTQTTNTVAYNNATLCTNCNRNYANPGRTWCGSCYQDSLRPTQGQYLCAFPGCNNRAFAVNSPGCNRTHATWCLAQSPPITKPR